MDKLTEKRVRFSWQLITGGGSGITSPETEVVSVVMNEPHPNVYQIIHDRAMEYVRATKLSGEPVGCTILISDIVVDWTVEIPRLSQPERANATAMLALVDQWTARANEMRIEAESHTKIGLDALSLHKIECASMLQRCAFDLMGAIHTRR